MATDETDGSTIVSEIAVGLAAYGLADAGVSLPAAPLDSGSWAALIEEVRLQRLSGFLGTAIADGAMPVTAPQDAQSRAEHHASTAVCLMLEALLVRTAELFERRGIDYRVLKGPAFAQLVYDNPALRPFHDLDLLVRSEDFDAAARVLTVEGGRRAVPEPRPGFDRRFGKGACFAMPQGLEIDLHRTFVPGPFGLTVDLPRLFENSAPFSVRSRFFPALAGEERFLHACFHAVLGRADPRLMPLRDVAQIATKAPLDVDVVLGLATEWECQVVVAQAVSTAWSTFELPDGGPLWAWANAFEPTRRDLRRVSPYLGALRSHAGQSVRSLRVIRGVRNKLAFARSITLPDHAPGPGARVRQWCRGLRALLPGGNVH